MTDRKTVCFFLASRAALGRVCMKLVVVMGITWVTDVISWIHVTLNGDRHALWIVPDMINALHGVFIFIVLGCQPQVRRCELRICTILETNEPILKRRF